MPIPTSCPADSPPERLHSLTLFPAVEATLVPAERLPAAGKRDADASHGRLEAVAVGRAMTIHQEDACTSDEAKIADGCRSDHHRTLFEAC